jgi:hypothetical protein
MAVQQLREKDIVNGKIISPWTRNIKYIGAAREVIESPIRFFRISFAG